MIFTLPSLLLVVGCPSPTGKAPVTDDSGMVDSSADSVNTTCITTECYLDEDGDGLGGEPGGYEDCGCRDDAVLVAGDCDDGDASVGAAGTRYRDADQDGYGAEAAVVCPSEAGFSDLAGDCDDTNDTNHPNAPEACDGLDTDCGGDADTNLVTIQNGASFSTITEAVAAAGAGDTLLVCPGRYDAAVQIVTDLRIEGWGDRSTVILQGAPGTAVLTVSGSLSLAHLTVTGGGDNRIAGGGVSAEEASALTIEDCVFTDNNGSFGGAIRAPDNGVFSMTGSDVSNNTGRFGGGVCAYGGEILNSILSHNTAEGGGGLAAFSGPGAVLDLTGTTISENGAPDGYGGGMAIGGDFRLIGGVISGNEAAGGAGLYTADFTGQLEGTEFRGNHARRPANGYAYGGGLFVDSDAAFSLLSCIFSENESDDWGGGVYAAGAALYLENGAITGNRGLTGGGIFLDGYGTAEILTVDLGSGAGDNAPDDVALANGMTYNAYGAATSALCDSGGCLP